ncbi:extracellular solute-binding protein [Verrucomicrobiales bacterium]|nr:extracellular solute-binding protein [Verrucomicrobiales bacterium]
MLLRLTIVLLLLAGVLIAPFAFRPGDETADLKKSNSERLVIITPHNESIQSEFARGFVAHMKQNHQRDVFVDWRQPGGTSEIARFLRSEFATRFETLWKKETGLPFSLTAREAYANGKLDSRLAETKTQQGSAQQSKAANLTGLDRNDKDQVALASRNLFLESDTGVGIDLFFGGGAYDFNKQASAGNLVGVSADGKYGPGALAKEKPDWFSDEIMPATVSGEPFRDEDFRWVGTVLSAFGICYNTDVLDRLGINEPFTSWSDLGNPKLFGQVALADPTKSGSTTKAFEMLIQEKIQHRLTTGGGSEAESIAAGWDDAMQLILKISANSRYFTDSGAKVPRDVAMGDAAAGMCIDFYGRTFNELYRRDNGSDSRVQFLMPVGGTSIGADPIGMLRGAPNPELAHRFVEYVLSPEGQKLWNYKAGSPNGPTRFALRRPPIRKDFYSEENRKFMTDPDVNPYEISKGFTYHPEWTGALFASLRFVIKASCIDPHEEQQEAWRTLIEAGMPRGGAEEFEDISLINYSETTNRIAEVLAEKDKIKEITLARELSGHFRARYEAITSKWNTHQLTAAETK